MAAWTPRRVGLWRFPEKEAPACSTHGKGAPPQSNPTGRVKPHQNSEHWPPVSTGAVVAGYTSAIQYLQDVFEFH